MVAATQLTREEAIPAAWEIGDLWYKLRPYQRELYDAVWSFLNGQKASRKLFVDCHRRFGKSFVLFLVAVEVGLGKGPWKDARRTIRFAAPTMADLEEIYIPIAEEMFEDCPEHLCPVWQSSRGRGHFLFPSTGSRLYLFGVDAKHYRKARGKACHFGVVDEAGACEPGCGEGIKHVVNSILLPQTFSVDGRIVLATTPPETPAHDSHSLKSDALAAGTYIRRTLDETARYFGPGAVTEYERESGGRDSTAFRREYLCEWIVDMARAVCPEFTAEKAKALVKPVPPPTHEKPLVSLDVGWADWSHVLFAYYDFRRAVLCIQAETRIRRMRTDQLAAEVKAWEARLWTGPDAPKRRTEREPFRVSDVDLILLADLSALHGLHFMPTTKDEKESMVNQMRLWVQTNRIQIDPSCVHLVRQLHNAIWDKPRKSFERTSEDGHFDAVDSLVYLVRNCPVGENPYPALAEGVTPATHHIPKSAEQRDEDKAFRQMFGLGRRVH